MADARFVTGEPSSHGFTIGEVLGEGSFATVRRVSRNEGGTVVDYAMKSIAKRHLGSRELDALQSELDVLGSLSHPSIVHLILVFDTEATLHLVLTLCSGGELFDSLVAKGHYTEREAARIMGQVASALEYCHGRGIAHRDLKPENLLLDSLGNVCIADFGLAKACGLQQGGDALMSTACGTPG